LDEKLENLYICGISQSSWGNPVHPFSKSINTEAEGFVAKISPQGELLWNTFLAEGVRSIRMAVSQQGQIYLAGTRILSWGGDIQVGDSFMAKMDNQGELIWNNLTRGKRSDDIRSMLIDKDSNIYLGGNTKRRAILKKFDSAGLLLWKCFLGETSSESELSCMKQDNNGNIYAGVFSKKPWGIPSNWYSLFEQKKKKIQFNSGYNYIARITSEGKVNWHIFTNFRLIYDVGNPKDLGQVKDFYFSISNNIYIASNNLITKLNSGGAKIWENWSHINDARRMSSF
jgi:hypothetical protein